MIAGYHLDTTACQALRVLHRLPHDLFASAGTHLIADITEQRFRRLRVRPAVVGGQFEGNGVGACRAEQIIRDNHLVPLLQEAHGIDSGLCKAR